MSNLFDSLSSKPIPVELEEYEIPKLNPFEFVDDISHKKSNLYSQKVEGIHKNDKKYESLRFIINKRFSHFIDTIIDSNNINIRYNVDTKLHFDYLYYSIKSKFRKGTWPKKSNIEYINMLKRKYGYNQKRAEEVLPLLSEEQLNKIKESLFLGGTSKNYDF
jgi:hypothetical protein|tara:strand:+ start:2250 stop:2735 length:486 start_codon:yes stop_codon:yes gene_type:complete